jgi:hypothetical protein
VTGGYSALAYYETISYNLCQGVYLLAEAQTAYHFLAALLAAGWGSKERYTWGSCRLRLRLQGAERARDQRQKSRRGAFAGFLC